MTSPLSSTRPATHRSAPRHARRGFSMIELLIVITVIAILVSLLLVGVQAAVSRARVAQVVAEMKNFEAAIRQFEKELGMQPPSFIKLHESAAGWAPASADADTRSSRAILKQLWPSFDFTTMGDGPSSPAPVSFVNPTAGNSALDLNGDGDENDTLFLCGSECLVFFLGGLQKRDSTTAPLTTASMTGFSKVPTGPLSRISAGSAYGPYYTEFDSKRFKDLDSDGMPEYCDAIPGQQRPLQYLSSYEGVGYRPYGRDGVHGTADDDLLANSMLWVYTRSLGTNVSSPAEPYNPKTFQIISPGFDGEYGKGGIVDAETGVSDMTTAAPLHLPAGNTNAVNTPNTTVTRVQPDTQYERDNIVNFLSAELH